MTAEELIAAAHKLPPGAMVNLLTPADSGEEWRELLAAYPDRELYAGKWRDSLTLVVGEEVR